MAAIDESFTLMENMAPLRIVIVGHVDHGKSTLIGRLLHDTNSLDEGKLEYVQAVCQKRGVPFEWAFLLDALQAERDQNITIDTCQIWFQSARRPYVIIDAPGHKEFLKNMITGAAGADAAVLLIAANEGVQEQSRRHAYLLQMLGIKELVVLVNKMDLVDHDEAVFDAVETEYRAFLTQIGLVPRVFVPISARQGSNIATHDEEHFDWYEGPTVIEALDGFLARAAVDDQPLRFPIQDVYRFDDRRILAGRIEAGALKVGDRLVFAPSRKGAIIKSIERWRDAPEGEESDVLDRAVAGESIGITLDEQIFVERGHVASHDEDAPTLTTRLEASVFWMGPGNLEVGRTYRLKLTTQEVECKVVNIRRVIDAGTLDIEGALREHLERDDVAEVEIETSAPIAVDLVKMTEATSRFVLVDEYDVAGGGIITGAEPVAPIEATLGLGRITSRERRQRNGHRGAVVWVQTDTGSPRIFERLERALFQRGIQTVWLDEADPGPISSALTRAGLVVIASYPEAGPPLVAAEETSIVIDLRSQSSDESRRPVQGLDASTLTQSVVDYVLPLLRPRSQP